MLDDAYKSESAIYGNKRDRIGDLALIQAMDSFS